MGDEISSPISRYGKGVLSPNKHRYARHDEEIICASLAAAE